METKQNFKDKCCGNCDMYFNEDMTGAGWCDMNEEPRDCDECCESWGDVNALPENIDDDDFMF